MTDGTILCENPLTGMGYGKVHPRFRKSKRGDRHGSKRRGTSRSEKRCGTIKEPPHHETAFSKIQIKKQTTNLRCARGYQRG